MLWRDRIVGWGNLTVTGGQLQCTFGYVSSQPRERGFRSELEAELERVRKFLGIESGSRSQITAHGFRHEAHQAHKDHKVFVKRSRIV